MAKIIDIDDLTQEELDAIKNAREEKARIEKEKLEAEAKVRLQQQANLEDQKRRTLQNKKYKFDKVHKAYYILKSELTKVGLDEFVELVEEEVEEEQHLRTYNKHLPSIKYTIKYWKANIRITRKRFYEHDNSIHSNTETVKVEGDLVEAYWTIGTHRKLSPKTLAERLANTHSDAKAQYEHHNKRANEVKDLLLATKKKYGSLANVESIEIAPCYTKAVDYDKTVCIKFKSGSAIYLGYRYPFEEEYSVIKTEDRLESQRTEKDWIEMFNNQEKIN